MLLPECVLNLLVSYSSNIAYQEIHVKINHKSKDRYIDLKIKQILGQSFL